MVYNRAGAQFNTLQLPSMAWPLSCLICDHCSNSWGISRKNCENMTLTGEIWNKLCNDSEYFLYLRLKHTYVQVQEQPPILITFSAWALSEVLFTFSPLYLYQALYSENSNFWVTSGVFKFLATVQMTIMGVSSKAVWCSSTL